MKATILIGDVLQRLAEVADASVQCCVTSPPYWGLRDYGTASWEGGDGLCDHLPPDDQPNSKKMTAGQKTSHAGRFAGPNCFKCGAKRIDAQLGLEQTPEEYVRNMVEVFRQVKRVLADDGVVWLNLGDSYWNNFGGGSGTMTTGNAEAVRQRGRHNKPKHELFKIKDLIGVPWRVAFALQEDGWWLRQDIIWHKSNPMPESVTDRCTKAHEYLFMLTKNARYAFDSEAIKEPAKWERWGNQTVVKEQQGTAKWIGDKSKEELQQKKTRNKRSVWSIPTKPFRGAHFAVMPEALVEPCILATSKPDDLVLDPFTGSGTVAVVAMRHSRHFIGTELNPEYAEIAKRRITDSNPLMNEVTIDTAQKDPI